MGYLSKAECGEDQRTEVCLQELDALDVVRVVRVEIRVEGAGVDYERDRAPPSAARISSMRSETSLRPLWTAPAADSLRLRPPTNRASRASRVISLIVDPRRRASCRSRASSSSGILTVVRFMICQHTQFAKSKSRRVGACRAVITQHRTGVDLTWGAQNATTSRDRKRE